MVIGSGASIKRINFRCRLTGLQQEVVGIWSETGNLRKRQVNQLRHIVLRVSNMAGGVSHMVGGISHMAGGVADMA